MELLDQTRNMMGPLSDEYKERIHSYLLNPTFDGWDDIHCIVIAWGAHRSRTIWQAVAKADPSFNDIGKAAHPAGEKYDAKDRWTKIPDALLVARAIKKALDDLK